MDATMTLALAQVEGSSDTIRNLETAKNYAQIAAQTGARLIVFPEMFMGLPAPERPPVSFTRNAPIEFFSELAAVARALDIAIIAGGWEPTPDPTKAFNTAIALDSKGNTLTRYRKVHLFDALNVRESDTMLPGGDLPPVLSLGEIRVGLAICYDLRFPEIFRSLADRGAELVIVPSAWYQGSMKEDHWLTLLRARAIENTFYVAGCNLIGRAFCGRSSVFDPFGTLVASATEDEDLVIARISTERVRSVREKLPSLQNRRKDLF